MSDDTVPVDMRALLADVDPDSLLADRYRLGGVLGQGGMAVVLAAHDELLDRPVAVKVLRERSTSVKDRARFADEARILAGLSHPHLVKVLDAGFAHARPFLVMELVTGKTLADEMDGGVVAPERLATIGGAVAAAVAWAHDRGVVHRDVKPGNVLLGDGGTIKLADFGIAQVLGETAHHTSTGMLVGTVSYLAPEQVAGEPLGTAVDVYALGLTMLEALTGFKTYEGTSIEAALARLSRSPVVPTTLPSPWPRLLTQMTSRQPGERPTALEVAVRLGAAETDELPAVAVGPRWQRIVVPVGAATLVLALAGGALMARGDDSSGVAGPPSGARTSTAAPSPSASSSAATGATAGTGAVAAVVTSPVVAATSQPPGQGAASPQTSPHHHATKHHRHPKAHHHHRPKHGHRKKPHHGHHEG